MVYCRRGAREGPSHQRTDRALGPAPSVYAVVRRAGAESGVSFAVRGNLIILAPPLVIDDADLDDALSLMERLLTELKW
jgi:taurine---2-oxoglutarate transaminase